jgi:hypothetical protein
MTSRYIGDWGTSAPADAGAGPLSDPWLTFDYAVSQMADGDTLNIADGTYVLGGSEQIQFRAADDDKELTFVSESSRGVTITSTVSSMLYFVDSDNMIINWSGCKFISTKAGGTIVNGNCNNWTLNLDDCQIGDGSSGTSLMAFSMAGANTGRTLSVTNSDVYTTGDVDMFYIRDVDLTVDTCVLHHEGSATKEVLNIIATTAAGDIVFKDNTITGFAFHSPLTAGINVDRLEVTGNTVTLGEYFMYCPAYIDQLIITGNVVTIDCGGAAAYGIVVGEGFPDDVGWPGMYNPNPLGQVVVNNNTIVMTNGDGAEHGIALQAGVIGGECAYNTTDVEGGISLVSKAQGLHMHHNVVLGTMFIKGANRGSYHHNTVVAKSGIGSVAALRIERNPTSGAGVGANPSECDNNTIINNIIDGSYAQYAISVLGNVAPDATVASNIIDFNCCVPGSVSLARCDLTGAAGSDLATIETLQAWWATNGVATLAKENESYSLNQDPVFINQSAVDQATGVVINPSALLEIVASDFIPLNENLWNSGRDSDGNATYMGAVTPLYGGRTGLNEGASVNVTNDTNVYFATKENGSQSNVNVEGTTFTVQDISGRLVWENSDWLEHIFDSNNDSIGENIIRFNNNEQRLSVSWEGGSHLFNINFLDFPNYSSDRTFYTLDAPRAVFSGTFVNNNGTGFSEEWLDHFIDTKTSDLENNEVTSQDVLYFQEEVNIKLEFSYPPKDYSALTDAQFVGNSQNLSEEDKSEIYYTLNGKNPTTRSNLYRGEFTLNSNSLGDNTILKAMIAYKGQFSPVYKAEIVIV